MYTPKFTLFARNYTQQTMVCKNPSDFAPDSAGSVVVLDMISHMPKGMTVQGTARVLPMTPPLCAASGSQTARRSVNFYIPRCGNL